ncbi:Glutathione S-transferase 2 [Eumeta japonica]|uniref:glutathione transferase n=1 Tax=Eumeta variegata TaxID=151549 RepID=A0A4C1WZG9_EUMVA|nr:Glutathione S-transferase 2 [Eumeta japonica]
MAAFTNEEYADIMMAYGRADGNAREARRIYEERFPNKRLPSFSSRGVARPKEPLNSTAGHKPPLCISTTFNFDPPATNDSLGSLLGETLFGEMPTLEIDGKQYAQSIAICRYLGRKYGISGATPEEDLLIDQIVDFINDIRIKAAVVHYEEDEALKEKKFKDFSVVYPTLLKKLDSIIADNNGHLALGKLTWGDFVLTGILYYLKQMLRMPDLEEKYVNIKKVVDKVVAIPQVKAYVDTAPEDEF